MNWLSREAGQERRQRLNNALSEAMTYYLGPTGIPQRLNALGIFNPVNDMEQASQNALAMVAPGATGRERFNAGVGMVTDIATAVAPAYAASRVGSDGAAAIVDSLTGIGAMQRQGMQDAGQRFVADEAGNMRFGTSSMADEIARMLREGRAEEITDDMMAALGPNDQMRLFQLYEEGATGMRLPMDEASRMARAREMGFDTQTPLYHGTGADFAAFDGRSYSASGFGTHMGAPEAADQILRNRQSVYARMQGAPDYTDDSAVLSLLSNTDGSLRIADTNTWQPDQVMGAMAWSDDPRAAAAYERINADPNFPRFGSEVERASFIQKQLENDNVPGFVYENTIEGGGDSYATFKPRNIRSRFARFDPRLRHLANLSAAGAGVAILPRDEE